MNLSIEQQAIADVISASPSGWHAEDIAEVSGLSRAAIAELAELGLMSTAGCSHGFYRWVG